MKDDLNQGQGVHPRTKNLVSEQPQPTAGEPKTSQQTNSPVLKLADEVLIELQAQREGRSGLRDAPFQPRHCLALYTTSFLQPSSGHPTQTCYHCTESRSSKLLGLVNSTPATSSQHQGVIQETPKLLHNTSLPQDGLGQLQFSLYKEHRPQASQLLFAHVGERDSRNPQLFTKEKIPPGKVNFKL